MSPRRATAVALLLLAPASFAQAAVEPKKISVEFRGKLKDGLRQIAAEGGINLVVTGDLDQPAEVYLKGVSAEEALSTVAAAYHLKAHRQGSIWTLRPMTKEEIEEAKANAPKAEPALAPAVPGVAPVPPLRPSSEASETSAAPEREDADADEAEENQAEAITSAKEAKKKLKIQLKRTGKSEKAGTGPVVVESGEVVDSAAAFGGPLTVQGGAVVEGDAVAFGGDVILESGAVVEGDAVSFGGTVRKHEGAVVEGDQVNFGGAGLGAAVAKQIRDVGPDFDDDERFDRGIRLGMPGFFVRFAVLFGLGFLFMMFAPTRMRLIEGELKKDPLKCGLTGLVGALLSLPLTVLLTITIIGIPFAVVLWILVGLAVAMGLAAVASEIGLRLPVFRSRKTQALMLALGLLVMMIAAEIPVAGPLAMAVVSLAGLGAIIRTRFGQPPKGYPEPEPAPTTSTPTV